MADKGFEVTVQHINRQSHHIIKRSPDFLDPDISDPFLYTITTGFIIRFKMINIIFNFFILSGGRK